MTISVNRLAATGSELAADESLSSNGAVRRTVLVISRAGIARRRAWSGSAGIACTSGIRGATAAGGTQGTIEQTPRTFRYASADEHFDIVSGLAGPFATLLAAANPE